MKFSVPLALACFSAGVLSNVTPRHPVPIKDVIGACQTSVISLDVAVNAYNGGDASPMENACTALVDRITSGNSEIAVQVQLSLSATLELIEPVTHFITHVKALVEHLKAKRDVVKAALKCGLVRENIEVINTAAGTFIETLVGKCNPLATGVAKQKAQILQSLLNGCKEYYSTSNCS